MDILKACHRKSRVAIKCERAHQTDARRGSDSGAIGANPRLRTCSRSNSPWKMDLRANSASDCAACAT